MEEKSIFQKIGDAVVDFAPGIATVLAATGVGAPIAGAVGAVGALGRAFGLGSTAKPEEVLSAISADPEIRLKAMIADNDFVLKKRDQDIEEMKAELADVQSARSREVEITKTTGKRDLNMIVVGWVIILGYMGTMAFLLYSASIGRPIKDETGILFILLGNLVTFVGMVVGYLYGTSKSSADKNEQIGQMRKQLANGGK
jgi:hypothetical protein